MLFELGMPRSYRYLRLLVRERCRVGRRLNNVLPGDDEGGDNPGDDIAQPDDVRARICIEIRESWDRVDHPIGHENRGALI
jgi:hypothetical protein